MSNKSPLFESKWVLFVDFRMINYEVILMLKPVVSSIVCCAVFLALFAQADDTLVLSLSFDEGKGEIVSDASEYGNNGTIKGDVAWVAGKYGSALSFDGQSGFIEIPHSESLNVESAFTQAVWAYPMDVAREQNVAEKGFWVGSWLSHIKTVRGYVFAIAASGWQPIWLATSADSALNAEEWAHLAMTWDGTTRALYVNGKLDGTDQPDGQLVPNTHSTGVHRWRSRKLLLQRDIRRIAHLEPRAESRRNQRKHGNEWGSIVICSAVR